jgi:phage gp36-like protein
MTLIQMEWKPGGVLTNATSVKFSDPTAAYGLRRVDTEEILVADGVDMDNIATGRYEYDLADPEADLRYEYWIEIIYLGNTSRVHKFVDGADLVPTVELYAITLTSSSEIRRLYSTIGVNLRLDDMDDLNQLNMMNELVNGATDTIASYTLNFYNTSALVNSQWVRRRATIIAAYYLSMRRANGTQFGMEYQRIIEELKQFLTGKPPIIPDAVVRCMNVPTVSDYRVDDRQGTRKLRVAPDYSTQPYPGRYNYTPPLGNDISS